MRKIVWVLLLAIPLYIAFSLFFKIFVLVTVGLACWFGYKVVTAISRGKFLSAFGNLFLAYLFIIPFGYYSGMTVPNLNSVQKVFTSMACK